MIRNVLVALAMVAAVPAMTACSATPQRESAGEYIDSSVVSAKVRTAIAKDEKLSIFDIDVTTYRNVVQLSGFVDSMELKNRATTVAKGVEGVREVRNNIEIKPAG